MKKLLAVIVMFGAALVWRSFSADKVLDIEKELNFRVALRSPMAEVVNATGVIKPRNGAEVRVGSRLSGVLKAVHVDVGDTVERGQLLAELEDLELLNEIALQQGRIEELDAQLAFNRQLLERNLKASILPDAELANLRKEVAVGSARVKQASAALESQRILHAHTRVLAPIGGTVASVSTRQGETVAASFAAPTFLTIIDLERLEIQAYVDEADIGRIAVGQAVTFSVDTWPGVDFRGMVRTIHPSAAVVNNVVNYVVIIDMDNSDEFLLRPEMTAHVRFVIYEVPAALVINRAALLSEAGAYYVMVPGAQGLEKRRVQLGIVHPGDVEIIAGLSEGNRYLADRQQWLALQP